MKIRVLLAMSLSCAIPLLTGCGSKVAEEALRANKELTARVARLEQSEQQLKREVEAMRLEQTATLEKKATEAMGSRVAALVDEKIEERLGSHDELQNVVKAVIRDEMAAFESRQSQNRERGQRDPARRQEWEQRRTQWEQERWQTLSKDLNLTDEQVTKMKAASQAMREQIQKGFSQIREQGFDWEKVRQGTEQLKTQYEGELSKILTPEQLEAYRKRPDSMMRMMDFSSSQSGRRSPPPDNAPDAPDVPPPAPATADAPAKTP